MEVFYGADAVACRMDIVPLTLPKDWPTLQQPAIPLETFDSILNEIAPPKMRGKLRAEGSFSVGFRVNISHYENVDIERDEVFDDNAPRADVSLAFIAFRRAVCASLDRWYGTNNSPPAPGSLQH